MAYLGPPPSQKLATPTSQYFSGNGSTTAFTLNRPVNVAEDLNVYVNNVAQQPGAGKSYTATGTTLTFDAAPDAGTNNVYVVYRGLAEPTTRLEHPSGQSISATTGTFSGAVTAASTASIAGHASVGVNAVDSTRALTVAGASDGSGSSILVCYNSSLAAKFAVRDDGVITAGSNLSLDASGRLTVPNQPLFVATTPIVGTSGAVAASPVYYKRWTTVLSNIGSNFNNASGGGFFTAPVAGRYYILMKAGHKVTYSDWCGMYLYKNSTNIGNFWDPPDSSSNGNYTSNNANIILDLAANDTCGVGYHSSYSDISANANNWISIGLLH